MKKIIFLFFLILPYFSFGGTVTVTNTNDSGTGSLRASIASATAGDTIRFSQSLIAGGNATIDLTSVIIINKSLVVKGLYNSADTLFISSGNRSYAVIRIDVSTQINQKFVFDSICFFNTILSPVFYTGKDFTFKNSLIKGCERSLRIENFNDTVSAKIINSTFINNITLIISKIINPITKS